METSLLPPTSTRVERNTATEWNEIIRTRADASIARLEGAGAVELEARFNELDREWDVERLLQANASVLVVAGTVLGYFVDRRFLALPAAVLAFFAQHALQGWCPPIPIFRRHGFRTVREIERERYALKALRGDFNEVPPPYSGGAEERVRSILHAIDA
jgi:hypothetical protein